MTGGLFPCICSFVWVMTITTVFVTAVRENDFIHCKDSSYCVRNRLLVSNKTGAGFAFESSSLQVHGSKAVANILHPDYPGVLEVAITAYRGGVVRIRVKEAHPISSRYEVQDVVDESNLEALALSWDSQANVIRFDENKAIAISESFAVQVLVDSEPVIVANQRGLFNLEWLRPSSSLEKAGWAERFRSFTDSRPRGPESVGLDFSFPGATHVYGVPEHADSLALRNTRGEGIQSDPYRLYNLDVFEYELNSKMALYGSVPMVIAHGLHGSSGVFWLNAAETWVDVTDSEPGSGKDLHWFSEAGIVDAFMLIGRSPDKVFLQYAMLTGTTALPQLFSLGYHQCRWNYHNEADVESVDRNFDRFNIPYDVIWLDIEHTDHKKYFTWDEKNFPHPANMIDRISSIGRKVVAIVDPHIKEDTSYSTYKSGNSQGVFIKSNDGSDFTGWCWPGTSLWPDFFSPAVRAWWSKLFAYDVYRGSTSALYIWNDMNEPSVFNGPEVSIPRDSVHLSGWEHRSVHNLYGLQFHRATAEGLLTRTADRNDRPFVLSRAFFAGTQRIGPVWTGDNAGTWDHLAMATPMLLTLGVAGITFSGGAYFDRHELWLTLGITADVGGFFGNPSPELLARWYQAGAFYPFFRGHAHLETKRREPWLFGEPYTSIIRAAIRMRYQLLPYYYTLFYENTKTGRPVMRPLWAEFPKDEKAFDLDDQFMIGSSLLVKPVARAGIVLLPVYLPPGSPFAPEIWYDYLNHSAVPSGRVVGDAPLEKVPVYLRGGSILFRKDRPRRSSAQMRHDPYTVVVALDALARASGSVYVDDGHTFDYRQAHYIFRTLAYENNMLRLEVPVHEAGTMTLHAAVIERVVIIGVSEPSVVVLSPSERRLEYSYNSALRRLIIRKPHCTLGDAWAIRVGQ